MQLLRVACLFLARRLFPTGARLPLGRSLAFPPQGNWFEPAVCLFTCSRVVNAHVYLYCCKRNVFPLANMRIGGAVYLHVSLRHGRIVAKEPGCCGHDRFQPQAFLLR